MKRILAIVLLAASLMLLTCCGQRQEYAPLTVEISSSGAPVFGGDAADVAAAGYERLIQSQPADENRTVEVTRSDNSIVSLLIHDRSEYSAVFDARSGELLTIGGLASGSVDFTAYAADYASAHSGTDISTDEISGVCWYFDGSGLVLLLNEPLTIPYSELGRAMKPEYIADTTFEGLEPFGQGILGDDSTLSVTGRAAEVTQDRLVLELDDGSSMTLIVSGKAAHEAVEGIEGQRVTVEYYNATKEIASVTTENQD